MKTFFSQQVVDKTFIVYVVPHGDVVRASAASEDCWTVLLVESLPNRTFIHAHSILSKCPGVKKILKIPTVN